MFDSVVSVREYFGFLLGSRESIVHMAAARVALPIGALFVLSAALAREYDGADLRHEPWRLLLPFEASIATSFLIFAVIWWASKSRAPQPIPFIRGYCGFLALYWATAPLAWLYAIPWERWSAPVDAVRANLVTLAVVSLWRVVLMSRVIAVLTRCGAAIATCLVLTASAVAVLIASNSVPVPLFVVMGGLREPPDELLLGVTAERSIMASCGLIPILTIASIVLLSRQKRWGEPPRLVRSNRATKPLCALAILSVLAWLPILPVTQAEQMNRATVEQALRERRVANAISFMSAHTRRDFPPHWRPFRTLYRNGGEPLLLSYAAACCQPEVPDWVRALFREEVSLDTNTFFLWWYLRPNELHDLKSLALADSSIRNALAAALRDFDQFPPTPETSEEQRDLVRQIREIVEQAP